MKQYLQNAFLGLLSVTTIGLSSCVNEWPHPEDLAYNVTLTVHCDTEWLPEYTMEYTRAEGDELIYQFQIFNSGDTSTPVQEFSVFSRDFSREDFTVDLTLYPGTYDIYVWSDYYNSATGESIFYDTSDFSAVTYTTPYLADSNDKDAFRGKLTFEIKESMYLHPDAEERIDLKRPLARYIFVATDLEEFVENETSRGNMRGLSTRDRENVTTRDLEEELQGYSIRVIYPLYLPSVFNVYTDEPYDSWTGISYEGGIEPLSLTEASLGLDYVMISNDPSSVQVALEIYDSSGVKIGGTSTLTIPIERNRTTLVYGKFLTSQEDAGVTINPDFDGQYNIEYR